MRDLRVDDDRGWVRVFREGSVKRGQGGLGVDIGCVAIDLLAAFPDDGPRASSCPHHPRGTVLEGRDFRWFRRGRRHPCRQVGCVWRCRCCGCRRWGDDTRDRDRASRWARRPKLRCFDRIGLPRAAGERQADAEEKQHGPPPRRVRGDGRSVGDAAGRARRVATRQFR
jgi:hypothetical protein